MTWCLRPWKQMAWVQILPLPFINHGSGQVPSVQFSHSVVSNSLWPHGLQHVRLPCPSPTLELAHPHIHRVGDAIQPSHPLSPSPPAFRVFSRESALLIRGPKFWSFSFCISPSSEYLGLISFKIDWFNLAVQVTLKSLLQHHSSYESQQNLCGLLDTKGF